MFTANATPNTATNAAPETLSTDTSPTGSINDVSTVHHRRPRSRRGGWESHPLSDADPADPEDRNHDLEQRLQKSPPNTTTLGIHGSHVTAMVSTKTATSEAARP